jgi:hypothetical protein
VHAGDEFHHRVAEVLLQIAVVAGRWSVGAAVYQNPALDAGLDASLLDHVRQLMRE